jgi:hypothetical protein
VPPLDDVDDKPVRPVATHVRDRDRCQPLDSLRHCTGIETDERGSFADAGGTEHFVRRESRRALDSDIAQREQRRVGEEEPGDDDRGHGDHRHCETRRPAA